MTISFPADANVLVVAPHTDDAELGCGGLIARLAREGIRTCVIVFSAAEESMPDSMSSDVARGECAAAIDFLGAELVSIESFPVRHFGSHRQEILQRLIDLRKALQPSIVIGPGEGDIHQDHAVVADEIMRAFRGRASILGFDVPWNVSLPDAHLTVALTEADIDAKVGALSFYRSQIELQRAYFSEDVVRGLARVRGVKSQHAFAEAFHLRWLLMGDE